MDFAGIDDQADALEDLFALHAGVEIFDFKNRFAHLLKHFYPQISPMAADFLF
jgi:hypothetical protein